jgi:hypothetical protein
MDNEFNHLKSEAIERGREEKVGAEVVRDATYKGAGNKSVLL